MLKTKQAGALACLGCRHDLEERVDTHLFGITPNHSGSTFLREALATSRATWNLREGGQKMLGYVGPKPPRFSARLWAAEQRWIDLLTDARNYDWPRTRKAWYFQAVARSPDASVFCTNAPRHLLLVDDLARNFRNAKFLFMVRNPYAVCEGICRIFRSCKWPIPGETWTHQVRDLREAAARHVVTCLERQRRNIQAYGNRGVFFTYEAMCAEPERIAQAIRTLAPALDDLNLRQRLRVKQYHEMLTDMNARQIARLGAEEFATFNRVFREREDVLAWFGYRIMERTA